MKLKKKPHILIIGSGVLGAYLSKSLIGKKYNIIVTTRRIKKNFLNYKKLKIDKKVKFQKLNILNKKEIRKIINKIHTFNQRRTLRCANTFQAMTGRTIIIIQIYTR